MLHPLHLFAGIVDVLARLLVPDELLASLGMLALGQTCKLLGAHVTREAPFGGEPALPFAAQLTGLRVIALLGAGKFVGVIGCGLADA